MSSSLFAKDLAAHRCPEGHFLEKVYLTVGWSCDGCQSSKPPSSALRAVESSYCSYRCDLCDFDLCEKCWEDAIGGFPTASARTRSESCGITVDDDTVSSSSRPDSRSGRVNTAASVEGEFFCPNEGHPLKVHSHHSVWGCDLCHTRYDSSPGSSSSGITIRSLRCEGCDFDLCECCWYGTCAATTLCARSSHSAKGGDRDQKEEQEDLVIPVYPFYPEQERQKTLDRQRAMAAYELYLHANNNNSSGFHNSNSVAPTFNSEGAERSVTQVPLSHMGCAGHVAPTFNLQQQPSLSPAPAPSSVSFFPQKQQEHQRQPTTNFPLQGNTTMQQQGQRQSLPQHRGFFHTDSQAAGEGSKFQLGGGFQKAPAFPTTKTNSHHTTATSNDSCPPPATNFTIGFQQPPQAATMNTAGGSNSSCTFFEKKKNSNDTTNHTSSHQFTAGFIPQPKPSAAASVVRGGGAAPMTTTTTSTSGNQKPSNPWTLTTGPTGPPPATTAGIRTGSSNEWAKSFHHNTNTSSRSDGNTATGSNTNKLQPPTAHTQLQPKEANQSQKWSWNNNHQKSSGSGAGTTQSCSFFPRNKTSSACASGRGAQQQASLPTTGAKLTQQSSSWQQGGGFQKKPCLTTSTSGNFFNNKQQTVNTFSTTTAAAKPSAVCGNAWNRPSVPGNTTTIPTVVSSFKG